MDKIKYDDSQLAAIRSLNNTLVIAGAGSGKTSTIVGRVEYLIRNSIFKESEILIISFTNESVNSLRKKINYNVNIKTFHKLALDIINSGDIKKNIISDKYLDYIIIEYLNSYVKNNKKINILYKRILEEDYRIKTLISTFINIYKCNYTDIKHLFNLYKSSIFINKIYYKFILDVYLIYIRELESTNSLDLNDLIIKANYLIKENKRTTPYKHIIIDEFQDTSLVRFNLILNIMKQNEGTLFAVGDDYQSIYRFSGCDLSLFINFKQNLPNVNILHLNHNYRSSQELINISNNFIVKNKKQIKKSITCHKSINKPIKIIFYVDKKKVVNKVLDKIVGNTLILGRNNKDKESFCISENSRYLTIHKSKGLEEDNIIIINLEDSITGLPSKLKQEKIISNVLKQDYIIYEEERRLFYVALTRARNYVYLLVPKRNYSVFIRELINDNQYDLDISHID